MGNTTAVTLADDEHIDGTVATAAAYPSTIEITGTSGPITNVEVVIPQFSYNFPDDLEVHLVGPTGISVVLMSDVGGTNQHVFTDLAFRLRDGAPPLPDNTELTSGTFAPTNFSSAGADTDVTPAPAPPPGGSSLAAFDGTSPIGTWSLFVMDDVAGDNPVNQGGLGQGWSLELTVPSAACIDAPRTGSPTSTPPTSTRPPSTAS